MRAALDELSDLTRAPLLRALRENEAERAVLEARARYWQDRTNAARQEACELRAELKHARQLLAVSECFLSESEKRRAREVAVFTA